MNAAAFAIVLEAGLRSLLAALVIWAALRLLRVRNVPAQKAAWTFVLLAAFAMPFAMRWHWLPAIETIPLPAPVFARASGLFPALSASVAAPSAKPAIPGSTGLLTSSIPGTSAANTRTPSSTPRSAPTKSAAPAPNAGLPAMTVPPPPAARSRASALPLSTPASRPWPIRPLELAWFFYLAIAAALLLRLIAGLVSALRLWFAAKPVPSVSPVLDLSEFFARRVSVRCSSRVSSPVNIGSGIVLPSDFRSWDPEKLRIVLAHECSHVRQRDFYLQLFASVYSALFWFSPLGWWLKRKLSELGEAIGDRAGLEEAPSRSSYAQLLLEFASLPRPTRTGVAMARNGNLAPRIERLLNESTFIEAFAAGQRHFLLATLVVPVALFASTALVRVQAAARPDPAPWAAANSHSPGTENPQTPAAAPSPAPAAHPAAPRLALGEGSAPVAAILFAPSRLPSAIPADPPATAILIASAVPPPLSLPAPVIAPVPAAVAAAMGFENSPPTTFERTLSFSGQLQLSVATGSGNIHLTRGAANRLHIVGQIRVSDDGSPEQAADIAANPPIEQTGNVIRIGAQHEHWRGISISYEIEAPADTILSAASGSGNITDQSVGQNAKLQTGSGNVQALGLQDGFIVQTGSGNIDAEQTGQGDVKAQTGSGDLVLKGIHGALIAQTGSGNIKISGTPSGAWKLGAGSGDIDLWPGNTGLTLDATVGSGEVKSDPQMMVQGALDRHHIVGTINGGGQTVRIETGSGNIHVY